MELISIIRIVLVALAFVAATGAHARAFPSQPIRLIVPFPPGGAVDFFARVVQAPLTENIGVPIVIENKAGASGMIGAEFVARAPADGYTLLIGNIASLAINVGVYQKMTYDPVKDFTPIVRTVDGNYVLVVNPAVPVRTLSELITYAKANPGKVAYGSAGSGSLPHLATELIKAQTGFEVVHVPYKGGGPMVTDLLGGSSPVVIRWAARQRGSAISFARKLPSGRRLPAMWARARNECEHAPARTFLSMPPAGNGLASRAV